MDSGTSDGRKHHELMEWECKHDELDNREGFKFTEIIS